MFAAMISPYTSHKNAGSRISPVPSKNRDESFTIRPTARSSTPSGTGVGNSSPSGHKASRLSPPGKLFADCIAKSPLAPLFKDARIVGRRGCSAKAYTSLQVPHRGNVLVIGDAAAYVEIEIQGALMTGFRAGKAVAKELQSGDGFREYTGWWQSSFEFNSDKYLQVAQGFALVPAYTDDELDYLFSLIEDEELEGTYSQYKSPRIMWDAILRHEDRIAADRPDLHQKIKHKKLTLRDILQE